MKMKTKKIIKRILVIILIVITILGALSLLLKVFNHNKDDSKKLHLSYNIGAIDENGNYLESERSLYTNDLFKCAGLEIELDFNANIEYQIFFYNYNKEFISKTDKLTKNFKDELDETVVYARIMITPLELEVKKISFFEKREYIKQLEVNVSKDNDKAVYLIYKQQKSNELFTDGLSLEINRDGSSLYFKGAEYSDDSYVFTIEFYENDVLINFYLDGNIASYFGGTYFISYLNQYYSQEEVSNYFEYRGNIAVKNDCTLIIKFNNVLSYDYMSVELVK